MADVPNYLRSSVRPWPWQGHKWPGIHQSDIDRDGRVLNMRVSDEHGAWVEHPEDARVLIPADDDLSPLTKGLLVPRFRLLREGLIENYDGFTIPTPKKTASLDLNRNFTAMWSKKITGSGDHPLSEVEVDSLVRALAKRPNVCGYNAYHTSGGVLLRPPSSRPDSDLPPIDLWVWKEVRNI